MPSHIDFPKADELAPYQSSYVSLVQEDALDALERDMSDTLDLLRSTSENKGTFRYSPEKWSVKDVVNHIIDAERIFCYRALRMARGDQTELPGFDENDYVAAAGADRRTFQDLCKEFECVRRGTLMLFRSFDESVMLNRGVANKFSLTVRGIAYVVAGHARHHLNILKERYGLGN